MDPARCREFIAIVRQVRHDANNPLTAALGHVQLALEEPVLGDEEIRETLGVVESELRRLAEILRRLHAVRDVDPPASAAPPA